VSVEYLHYVHAAVADPLHERELDLRFRVLREPLGFERGSEIYTDEAACRHLIAVSAGEVIGCVLFHPAGRGSGRMLQLAVDPRRRLSGIGRELVFRLEGELADDGYRDVMLHAREEVVEFYQKLGYRCEGTAFIEIGIPHVIMRKPIGTAR